MTTSNETKAAAMGSELAAFSMRTVMTRLFQLLFSMLYSAMLTYAYRVCFSCRSLKPSLSTKILSINDFVTKLLSKLLRDFSNKVHLKSISKFINKVINRQYFCRWTCFKCTFTRAVYVNNFTNKPINTL